MTNAASTSNPSFIVNVGEAYPYPSLITPNIVTVKLSGKNKYNMWKTQMLCLLKSHQMYGFIDGQFPRPAGNGKGKVGDMEAWIISDSLVKGWILGSLGDEAFNKVVNHLTHMQKNPDFTAKDLWDELQRTYDPLFPERAQEKELATRQAESVIEVNSESEDAKSKDEPTENLRKRWVYCSKGQTNSISEKTGENKRKRRLYDSVLKGQTNLAIYLLEVNGLNPWDKITHNGNTVLHVAVGPCTKNHELLKKLLDKTPEEYTLLDLVNSDGSTLLHVAAIGGNIEAVNMLVERNPKLLLAKDKEGHIPLALSVSNMHIKTSKCLFKHMKEKLYYAPLLGKRGEKLVVLAISCQDFSLAKKIIRKDHQMNSKLFDSDAVLTALAQNFPRELNFWERCNEFVSGLKYELKRIICDPLRLFVKDTSQIHGDARTLLVMVCAMILQKDDSGTYHQHFTNSIFEATRRNTSTFIRIIMRRFPDAIWSTNEDGHNFIQYSVINRSEKIYNLLYEMSEHKNIYKTIKDSSGNTLLHLAARLAPTVKLNLISGAALQIQRELQWFKEVERFICPLHRIQKNLDDETPQEVFTKEHKDLVTDGENWIKKTAESYTITAALIITIVFAAAITVPGGNNQESGIPIFTNNTAFTVFAISDAISLFTAVTSLLMFLSILTARFSEQDFLFKLPTKLIIGLTMLFLSTTAMIIAFGATLFLVFGQSNSSMLIPIAALTCLPITSFVTLQFPLIVELIRATYFGGFFVREKFKYFY